MFNGPGVAGAVLKTTSSLSHSLIQSLMLFLQIFNTLSLRPRVAVVRARDQKFLHNVHHLSYVAHNFYLICNTKKIYKKLITNLWR